MDLQAVPNGSTTLQNPLETQNSSDEKPNDNNTLSIQGDHTPTR